MDKGVLISLTNSAGEELITERGMITPKRIVTVNAVMKNTRAGTGLNDFSEIFLFLFLNKATISGI